MEKFVTLIFIVEGNKLKGVHIDENTTDMEEDSTLIYKMCEAALRGLIENSEDVAIQDLLNSIDR